METQSQNLERALPLASEAVYAGEITPTPMTTRLLRSVKRSIRFVAGAPLAMIRTTIRVLRGLFLYPICLIARAVTAVEALFSLPQRLTLFEDLLVITAQRGIPVLQDLKAFLDRQASGANPVLRGTLVTQDPLEKQVQRDLSDLLDPKVKQDRLAQLDLKAQLGRRGLRALQERTVGLQQATVGRLKTGRKSRAKQQSRSRATKAKR